MAKTAPNILEPGGTEIPTAAGGARRFSVVHLGQTRHRPLFGQSQFASTYGAAASVVVLIVWVYYSGQIFFLGAEFTKIFAGRYGSQPNRHPGGMVTERAGGTNASLDQPRILSLSDGRSDL
jgi:hypothetical protein